MSDGHNHPHSPNRFGAIPIPLRLAADSRFTGRGVTIALLDSGFYPHPDLLEPKSRQVHFVDLHDLGADFHTGLAPESSDWHGTQTSVACAGSGSLSGGLYRGLASDANLVLLKVARNGRIGEPDITRGLEWVLENKTRFGIRIVNISLGGDVDVPAIESAADRLAEEVVKRGVIVVVAAGNSGCTSRPRPIPPANAPSVITVGGYDDGNRLSGEDADLYCSNYGPTIDGIVKPEILGPAAWIPAPILPDTPLYREAELLTQMMSAPDYELPLLIERHGPELRVLSPAAPTESDSLRRALEVALRLRRVVAAHYQHVDGTSFASPIVASVVAQMLEANPKLAPAEVKEILVTTAEPLPGRPAQRQGSGVVNAGRAVARALEETHVSAGGSSFAPRSGAGKTVFTYHNDQASSVSLAGDFTGWDSERLAFRKTTEGYWVVEMDTPAPGRYRYKFVVDRRRWIDDPSHGVKEADPYGGFNSVLTVG